MATPSKTSTSLVARMAVRGAQTFGEGVIEMARNTSKQDAATIKAQQARVAQGKKMAAQAVKNDADWARRGGTWN